MQQPHIRPIVRGKRPDPTEFGQKLHLSVVNGYAFIEQTCWNNFNEGNDLPLVIENYFRRYGCFPIAVLEDKLYQTRKNRSYCKVRGIRLSGPALGRKRKAVKEENNAQMYQDACDRNVIEGKNGAAKRRRTQLYYVQAGRDFQDRSRILYSYDERLEKSIPGTLTHFFALTLFQRQYVLNVGYSASFSVDLKLV